MYDMCNSHVTRCDLSLVTRFNSLLTRCTEQPELCSSPGAQILEKEGGVWSDQFSPFDGHFKVGGPPYLFSKVVNPSPGLRSILLQ